MVTVNDTDSTTVLVTRLEDATSYYTTGLFLYATNTPQLVPALLTPCGLYAANSPCLSSATTNLTMWLTSQAAFWAAPPPDLRIDNTAPVYTQMTTSVTLTSSPGPQGEFILTVPSTIGIKTTGDQNITFPIQSLICSTNTSTVVIGVTMLTNSGTSTYCGPTLLNVSCSNRPSSFVYQFNYANPGCNIAIESTYTLSSFLFTQQTFALYQASQFNGTNANDLLWADYSRPYSFTAAAVQIVSVGITSGQPANVTIGGVTVKAPPLLPTGLNGTLFLELNPKDRGAASSIASVDVKLDNGTAFKVSNLSNPLNVTIPMNTLPPLCKQTICHYWDTAGLTWATDGCQTLPSASGNAWTCSCNHATDFSLLLLDSQSGECSAEINPATEPFFIYGTLYIILGIVAAYFTIRVLTLRMGHLDIILQHAGLFIVCVLRAFLCLYQAGLSAPATVLELSAISAVPRLIEFMLFSFIVSQWGALLHFSMGTSNPFKKVRPYFIGVNVLATGITIYIFVAFGVAPSFDAAVVGEALLTVNSLLLSAGFMVYATWLHRQFSKVRNTANSGKNSCCPSLRIVMLGWFLSACFLLQAIFALACLFILPRGADAVTDPDQIQHKVDVFNGIYRLFNLCTLSCIIALYFEGVRKMVAKKEMSQVSSSGFGNGSVSGTSPRPSSNKSSFHHPTNSASYDNSNHTKNVSSFDKNSSFTATTNTNNNSNASFTNNSSAGFNNNSSGGSGSSSNINSSSNNNPSYGSSNSSPRGPPPPSRKLRS